MQALKTVNTNNRAKDRSSVYQKPSNIISNREHSSSKTDDPTGITANRTKPSKTLIDLVNRPIEPVNNKIRYTSHCDRPISGYENSNFRKSLIQLDHVPSAKVGSTVQPVRVPKSVGLSPLDAIRAKAQAHLNEPLQANENNFGNQTSKNGIDFSWAKDIHKINHDLNQLEASLGVDKRKSIAHFCSTNQPPNVHQIQKNRLIHPRNQENLNRLKPTRNTLYMIPNCSQPTFNKPPQVNTAISGSQIKTETRNFYKLRSRAQSQPSLPNLGDGSEEDLPLSTLTQIKQKRSESGERSGKDDSDISTGNPSPKTPEDLKLPQNWMQESNNEDSIKDLKILLEKERQKSKMLEDEVAYLRSLLAVNRFN